MKTLQGLSPNVLSTVLLIAVLGINGKAPAPVQAIEPPHEPIRPQNVVIEPTPQAPPTAAITGPQSGRVGDLLEFHAYESTNATTYKWILQPEGAKGLKVWPGGRQVVFANHNPGEYVLVLAVGNTSGGVDVTFHRFMVGQSLVPPDEVLEDEEPVVETQQQPTTQQVPFSTLIATLALKQDKVQAATVAGNIRQAYSLVESGNIESVQELQEVTADLVRRTVGSGWEHILSETFKHIPATISLPEAKAVWQELARGLDAIATGNTTGE